VTDSIEFSSLLVEDVDLISPIEQACHAFPSSHKLLSSCFSKRYRNFKMCLDGKVIGFYMAEFIIDEMTLHNICINPECQGKGYGRQLFDHFLEIAKEHKAVQLWLEVRESNVAAIALYQGNGFDVAGVRNNYYPAKNGREDALLMGSALFYD
jgi:ribosomal-protein-alanine N-acetyltransferase